MIFDNASLEAASLEARLRTLERLLQFNSGGMDNEAVDRTSRQKLHNKWLRGCDLYSCSISYPYIEHANMYGTFTLNGTLNVNGTGTFANVQVSGSLNVTGNIDGGAFSVGGTPGVSNTKSFLMGVSLNKTNVTVLSDIDVDAGGHVTAKYYTSVLSDVTTSTLTGTITSTKGIVTTL